MGIRPPRLLAFGVGGGGVPRLATWATAEGARPVRGSRAWASPDSGASWRRNRGVSSALAQMASGDLRHRGQAGATGIGSVGVCRRARLSHRPSARLGPGGRGPEPRPPRSSSAFEGGPRVWWRFALASVANSVIRHREACRRRAPTPGARPGAAPARVGKSARRGGLGDAGQDPGRRCDVADQMAHGGFGVTPAEVRQRPIGARCQVGRVEHQRV
jgi:hypothetical protein